MRSLQLSYLAFFEEAAYSNIVLKNLAKNPAQSRSTTAIVSRLKIRPGQKTNKVLTSTILFSIAGLSLSEAQPTVASCAPSSLVPNSGGLPRLWLSPGGEGGDGEGGPAADDPNDPMNAVIDRVWHIAGDLGFGGCLGVAAGYAMKELGKEVAFGIGMVFAAAQVLAYYGVIEIKWRVIKDKATNFVDVDGDGQFTPKDLKLMWKKLKNVLSYNLPAGGSFASGFALGLYYG